MLANWIHIVLVHFAVLGTPVMAYRVLIHRQLPMDAKSWKANYSGLIIIAVISTISYFTGPEAADYLKISLDSYSQDHVEDHALWGRVAFVIQVLTGLLGIMGWAAILQEEVPDRRISKILLLLLIANTVIIAYAAHLGGLIRRMDFLQ